MNSTQICADILQNEKYIVANMATALNEASCSSVYDVYFDIFDETSKMQKELFNFAYDNGWYMLENAEAKKIDEKYNTMNNKLNSKRG